MFGNGAEHPGQIDREPLEACAGVANDSPMVKEIVSAGTALT